MIRLFYKILEFFGFINIVYYKGKKPNKNYKNDAGFDLYVSENVEIGPKQVEDVKVYTKITSKKCWFLLINRSSTFHNKKLHVMTSIIDNGFNGFLHTCVYNPNEYSVKINSGDRISQVIPFKQLKTVLIEGIVKSSKMGRKTHGFGSSGV